MDDLTGLGRSMRYVSYVNDTGEESDDAAQAAAGGLRRRLCKRQRQNLSIDQPGSPERPRPDPDHNHALLSAFDASTARSNRRLSGPEGGQGLALPNRLADPIDSS